MSKAKKFILTGIILMASFAVANFVLAIDVGTGYGASIGLGAVDPRDIAARIINIVLAFLGILAVGLIIYGGFLWMTAAGDENRVDLAKKVLISAVIGLVIVLAAWGIATFVLNNLLQATQGGSSVGGPCSASPTSCVPSNALCAVGLYCDVSCTCQPTSGPLPPGPPGSPCDGNTLTPACEPDVMMCASGICDPGTCTCSSGGVGSPCDNDLVLAGCQKDNTLCLSGLFCDPSGCNCQLQGVAGAPCDNDPITPACEINGSACAPGFFCDGSVCLCASGSGVGAPCDNDTVIAGCQADNGMCSNDLTCDPAAAAPCTCQDFPVINWISPSGGFCSNNYNQSCTVDSDCITPGTCDLTTPNAAPGNIISIGGRYFGTTTGVVYFWDGSGFTIAGINPSTVNPLCSSTWTENQITVVVPPGVVGGPIRVERYDGRTDDTNAGGGAIINDFIFNTIVRPGLCKITKIDGYLNDTITYDGINFSIASKAKFGNYLNSISGKDPNTFTPTVGMANVPNIKDGKTTTFVTDGGQPSNYLDFTKLKENIPTAFIISFEPVTGAPGQYVTIRGNGFGASRGTSKVYFGNPSTGFEADYNFPDVCADSIWSDKQIIVKVPLGLPNNNYILSIDLGGVSIIDTSKLSPNFFIANDTLPLLPSLCKIRPEIGQIGTLLALYGEYFDAFDAANSRIRFSGTPSVDVFGAANISFWDFDPNATGAAKPYKAETKVPVGAITGLVKIVKGASSLVGNGLNFSIGNCLNAPDPDAACGGTDVCCPAGTYNSGRCKAIISDCAASIAKSVYEFDFNTGVGTNIKTNFTSCEEKSNVLGTCDLGSICPNVPGACSLFGGGGTEVTGSCIYNCNNVGACGVGTCTYNSAIDRCVSVNCSLPAPTINVSGKTVSAYCALYKGVSRYVFDENISCPAGWIKDFLNGVSVCVDPGSSCTLCNFGFNCVNDGNSTNAAAHIGACAVNIDVCPDNSTCQASNQCEKTASDFCSCCCRKANASADCCIPLTCEGTCGGDKNFDTGTYGSCSGCANAGTTQAEHDAACNCEGHSGQYCDTSGAGGKGICVDCAGLAVNKFQCTAHNTVCCVDPGQGSSCTGRYNPLTGNTFGLTTGSDGNSYCTYYECNSGVCNAAADPFIVASAPENYFTSNAECTAKCPLVNSGLGLSCSAFSASPPSTPAPGTCDTSICANPLACLQSDGSGPVFSASPDTCGFCCCDPTVAGVCSSLGAALVCQPDVGPCDGPGRGLCCGCKTNTDCVPLGSQPTAQGCGIDACCRARPDIISTIPTDGELDVCTNAEIRTTFNERMDISSFHGQVIVVGEFTGTCPAGTVQLAVGSEEKNSFIARGVYYLYNKIRGPFSWIFGRESYASAPPSSSYTYCAVAGSVAGEHITGGGTTLTFRPVSFLAANTKFFVIIKGDENLDNGKGVLDFWGIGMNGANLSPVPNALGSEASFGGIVFPRAYIWSFTTLGDIDGNKGACAIDRVRVVPSSYLFQTISNDLNENDVDPTNKSFDTLKDSDKVFLAQALSRGGRVLNSVSGYSWDWSWVVLDTSVAAIDPVPFAANAEKQLIRAASNITGVADKQTFASATVNVLTSPPTVMNNGNGKEGNSEIHVFLCANPWPAAIIPPGTWSPWRDNPDGMSCITGTCKDMNYELYYCRDQSGGNPLPAISTNITRGSSAILVCTDAVGDCTGKLAGEACGTGGICQDLLKESFFFR